ncbi:unnamed protein product [Cochlearia groenlandica]
MSWYMRDLNLRQSFVFSLRSALCHCVLLLGAPGDEILTEKGTITTGGTSCVVVETGAQSLMDATTNRDGSDWLQKKPNSSRKLLNLSNQARGDCLSP